MITIYLNGEKQQIDSNVKLDDLLDLFSLPKQRVAVELNRNVVRRQDWVSTHVNDEDRIEVVHFVGGG
jgi:sulfur carrier protein